MPVMQIILGCSKHDLNLNAKGFKTSRMFICFFQLKCVSTAPMEESNQTIKASTTTSTTATTPP